MEQGEQCDICGFCEAALLERFTEGRRKKTVTTKPPRTFSFFSFDDEG
jgi:hypothetical protein